MPFIGQDWRSPGEVWVKTDEGWERMKILKRTLCECSPRNNPIVGDHQHRESSSSCDCGADCNGTKAPRVSGLSSNNVSFERQTELDPPYCPITLKSTKEVAGYNTISEAFYLLDFSNAIKDIRRFNYICKLLHLLITENLTSLSGCATKVFFHMLEEVAWQVSSSQQNIHVLHTLLNDLKDIMKNYYCWGRPLGSTVLWQQHLRSIEKICQMVNQIKIKEPSTKDGSTMPELPEELIREILLRLSDYRDLMTAGETHKVMATLVNEQHIWRQLCKYHFTKQQIRHVLAPALGTVNGAGQKDIMKLDNIQWEQVFHKLRKKYGLKEEYADSLFLCRQCRCLFWKSFGHPCLDNRRNQDSPPPKSPPADQEKPLINNKGPSTSSSSSSSGPNSPNSSSTSTHVSGQSHQNLIHGQILQLRRVSQQPRDGAPVPVPAPAPAHNQPQQLHGNEVNQENNAPAPAPNNAPHNGDEPPNTGGNNNANNKENETDSLVPLHIPVPPQAFLKFFSL